MVKEDSSVMMSLERRIEVIAQINRSKEPFIKHIESFMGEMVKNPAYAFEWSRNAIHASCMIETYDKIILLLNACKTMDNIYEIFLEDLLMSSQYMKRSTHPISDFVDQNRIECKSRMVRTIRSFNEFGGIL